MTFRSSFAIAIALASTFLFPSKGNAQSEKLDELKAQYEAEVAAAEQELKLKYSAALERIQQDLQSRAQLTGALAVKRERDKIEIELAASGGSPSTPSPGNPTTTPPGMSEHVLSADTAKPLGEVAFTERWDTLTGWREAGSGAEWSLGSIPKGVYTLSLEYSSPVTGGTLKAKIGTAEFEIPVSGTGSWSTYETVEAGQVFSDPYQSLNIIIVDDAGSPFGLINLKSVKLTPIGG